MNHIVLRYDIKVVDQVSCPIASLCPDPGGASYQIIFMYFWKQLLQSTRKGSFRNRTIHLSYTGFPIFSDDFPKARPCQRVNGIPHTKTGELIPLTFECQHCIWPSLNTPINHTGKMNS